MLDRRVFLKALAVLAASPSAAVEMARRIPPVDRFLSSREVRRIAAWAEAHSVSRPEQGEIVMWINSQSCEALLNDPEFSA